MEGTNTSNLAAWHPNTFPMSLLLISLEFWLRVCGRWGRPWCGLHKYKERRVRAGHAKKRKKPARVSNKPHGKMPLWFPWLFETGPHFLQVILEGFPRGPPSLGGYRGVLKSGMSGGEGRGGAFGGMGMAIFLSLPSLLLRLSNPTTYLSSVARGWWPLY